VTVNIAELVATRRHEQEAWRRAEPARVHPFARACVRALFRQARNGGRVPGSAACPPDARQLLLELGDGDHLKITSWPQASL
jgi:hypothetical protein